MADSFNALTSIHKVVVFTYLISTIAVFFFGPSSWPVHYAYHGWNPFTGTAALPLIAQLIIYGQLTVGFYLIFDEKIRFVWTLLTYSEEAAAQIAAKNSSQNQHLLRSQLKNTFPNSASSASA